MLVKFDTVSGGVLDIYMNETKKFQMISLVKMIMFLTIPKLSKTTRNYGLIKIKKEEIKYIVNKSVIFFFFFLTF